MGQHAAEVIARRCLYHATIKDAAQAALDDLDVPSDGEAGEYELPVGVGPQMRRLARCLDASAAAGSDRETAAGRCGHF